MAIDIGSTLFINDDFLVPVNHLSYINDIKIFGIYSYVFQDQEKLLKLIESEMILNDPIAYWLIPDGAMDNNMHMGKVFKALLKSDNPVFDDLETIEDVANSEEAMIEIVNSIAVMTLIIETARIIPFIVNSEIAMSKISDSEIAFPLMADSVYASNLMADSSMAIGKIINSNVSGLKGIMAHKTLEWQVANSNIAFQELNKKALEGSGSGTSVFTAYAGKALVIQMRVSTGGTYYVSLVTANIISNDYNKSVSTNSTTNVNTYIIMNPVAGQNNAGITGYIRYIPLD